MKTTTTTRINDTVITTERCWDYDSVRTCCIRNSLYTCGTCKQYEAILQFVEENGPTTENVYTVALDIWAHSDDQTVTNIMHHLERDAIRTYFETEIAEDALDEALAQEAEEELDQTISSFYVAYSYIDSQNMEQTNHETYISSFNGLQEHIEELKQGGAFDIWWYDEDEE